MKETRIDYLQFSASITVEAPISSISQWAKKSNIPFYRSMTTYDSGAVKYSGNPNTDKDLYVLSGATCERLNVDARLLEKIVGVFQGTVSRLDLAVTTNEPFLDQILKDRMYIVSEKFHKITVISDAEFTPQTIYIGDMKSRGKKGIVRAYDKAFQMSLEDVTRHRIEIELRKDDAQLGAQRIASGGTIESVMNSRFRIDRKWYIDMMTDEVNKHRFADISPSFVSEIERKMSWVEKQVIPSLKLIIDYDKVNNTGNFKRLMNLLGYDFEIDSGIEPSDE